MKPVVDVKERLAMLWLLAEQVLFRRTQKDHRLKLDTLAEPKSSNAERCVDVR